MQQEVALSFAAHAPPSVVQSHVVEPAQQNAAIDVGSPAVGVPMVDVMRLTVQRLAGRTRATGIRHRERQEPHAGVR